MSLVRGITPAKNKRKQNGQPKVRSDKQKEALAEFFQKNSNFKLQKSAFG